MIIKDKKTKYKQVVKEVVSFINDESDVIANLANISAILKIGFPDFFWVGFYILRVNELVLGPFQGKPACVRIQKGKGVCGTAIKQRTTIIVPDVSKFDSHIYCDPDTKSEIVIPIYQNGKPFGVLKVDSYNINNFDDIDRFYLEHLGKIIFNSDEKIAN